MIPRHSLGYCSSCPPFLLHDCPRMSAFFTPPLPSPTPRRNRSSPKCNIPLSEILQTPFRELRTGSVVVPRHLWDARMRRLGVYRSVEYRIEQMTLDSIPIISTSHVPPSRIPDVITTLRPFNRLIPRFERAWPVQVSVREARLVTYKADLLNCALVTLSLASSFIGLGLIGPHFVAIYSIPTESMAPTLLVGDALLVEKVSLKKDPPHRGEIVFFRPPKRLVHILKIQHERPRWIVRHDVLFVKRVVAIGGDVIEVHGTDVSVNGNVVDRSVPGSPEVAARSIPDGYLFVVGDNADRSIDSRYWGLLPVEYVVGRPLARIFPLDRMEIGV